MAIELTQEEILLILWLLDSSNVRGREVMKRCTSLGDKIEAVLKVSPPAPKE